MKTTTLVEFDEATYNDILNRLGKITDFKVVEGGNESGSGIDVFYKSNGEEKHFGVVQMGNKEEIGSMAKSLIAHFFYVERLRLQNTVAQLP